jgi:hypothetical protein
LYIKVLLGRPYVLCFGDPLIKSQLLDNLSLSSPRLQNDSAPQSGCGCAVALTSGGALDGVAGGSFVVAGFFCGSSFGGASFLAAGKLMREARLPRTALSCSAISSSSCGAQTWPGTRETNSRLTLNVRFSNR